ncbi:hypothetical protein CH380_19145 [Leptospira adleri]|uniref:Inorganic pyrophosphatase domain-containing protein n=1 Tax=Leptospira adleri TaxID=2023186 RepID=A0A2M9YJB8_9LEPT|nr:hypothetical protein CH380_19145 [Leptospira adleri]PJZ61943.1 hypothetical protein CH376_11020 [Leptospira adleri]
MSVPKKKSFHDTFKDFFKKKYKKSDDKKTICVDFDGVIHSYQSGWLGIDQIPDPPVEGAFDWLLEISNFFNVIIYSSRCSDAKGIDAIKSFLNTRQDEWRQSRYARNLGVPKMSKFSDLFQYSANKIPAHLYLDDRGIQFQGVFPSTEECENFCSWVDSKEFKKSSSSLKIKKGDVNSDPTEAQKKAGNYKKKHLKIHDLPITIENPAGSSRKGIDPDGKSWETKMNHHYGYIKGSKGNDGDHIDVFIGPNPNSEIVFVINQVNPKTKEFDEHKVMLGFDSDEDARNGYHSCYEKGWSGLGDMVSMTINQFQNWLENSDTQKEVEEFFHKAQAAQVGERRTWNDGLQHEKTSSGDWKAVGAGKESAQAYKPTAKVPTSGSSKTHAVTHEQKAVEVLDRWKEFEQKAKERNKERVARTPPEKRAQLNDVKYAVPGDIVRIERPNSGKINRGHIAEVMGKVDDMIKIKLPSGSEFLFSPHDLAYAKSSGSQQIFSYQFLKSSNSENPNIHTFSDGNTYQKEGNGWRLISSEEENDSSPEEDKEFVEKAMKAGEKVPVKVLKNYPELLKQFPEYENRVKSIEALSSKFLKQ